MLRENKTTLKQGCRKIPFLFPEDAVVFSRSPHSTKMMFRYCATVVVIAWLAVTALGQEPTAPTYPGHSIGPVTAGVWIEAFYDFQCPDSQANWPVMQQVINHYGNAIRFTLHHFPLPYHQQGFPSAAAAQAIGHLNPSAYFKFVSILFDNQAQFYNAATFNMTEAAVYSLFATYAAQVGVSETDFLNKMNDGDMKYEVVLEWKMGASAGVYGTPFHRVNGMLSDSYGEWTLQQWVTFIDSLLSGRSRRPASLDL
jgi:protein-disulfide isomerase